MKVAVLDDVEGDVDAAGRGHHGVRMLIDCHLVQRVELCGLDRPARGADRFGHAVEARQRPAGQEDVRPLASEGASHRAADVAATAIEDSVLAFE